jgi:hypothetical protein
MVIHLLISFGFYLVLLHDFILSNRIHNYSNSNDEVILFYSFLPIVPPIDSSSDESICEKVRENISRAMGIELTQFDESEVQELKKRPELLHQRHGKLLTLKFESHLLLIIILFSFIEQRRVEFLQMINLVHQQVPLASLEAIRYDLGLLIHSFIYFFYYFGYRNNKKCSENNCKSK